MTIDMVEIVIIPENLTSLVRENVRTALDQRERAEKEAQLRTLYGEKQCRFQELESLIQEKKSRKEMLMNFITKFIDMTGEQTGFREELWGGLVDHIRFR